MQFLPRICKLPTERGTGVGEGGWGGDIDHSFRQICNVTSPLPLVSFLPVTERGVQIFVAAETRTSWPHSAAAKLQRHFKF